MSAEVDNLDVFFVAKNPPVEKLDDRIGARLSNTQMWQMIGEITTRSDFITVDEIPVSQELQAPANSELYERMDHEKPRCIIVETPGVRELAVLKNDIPQNLWPNVVALWRYTVLPRQPLLGTTEIDWRDLIAARMEFANSIGLNAILSPHQRHELLSIGVSDERIIKIPQQVGWNNSPSKRGGLDAESFREQYLDPDELGILLLTRIHPEKGLEWLPGYIKTLREVRRHLNPDASYRKVRVTLAGSIENPEFWINLQRDICNAQESTTDCLYADSIKFEYVGLKVGDELDDYQNAYDILLKPSPEESFGRDIVEAEASGMTVIGNGYCPATVNLLTEAPYTIGQLAPNSEKAAVQTLRLMEHPEILELMQANAVQWAKGHFTRERAMAGLRRVLDL